jgi:hypothetical protein
MKTIVTAGLAGLLLSGAAMAQSDGWSYVACELGFRSFEQAPEPDGSFRIDLESLPPATSQSSITYRFNANGFHSFDSQHGEWVPLCRSAEPWTNANCSLGENRLYSQRTRADQTTSYSYEVDIGRLTGAIRIIDWTLPGGQSSRYRIGTGDCASTTDPMAAGRRF